MPKANETVLEIDLGALTHNFNYLKSKLQPNTKFLAVVLAYYFLSKNAFIYFISTELLSLIAYYFFAKTLILSYGTQGVVIANFIRYFCYLFMVIIAIFYYFRTVQNRVS